MIVAHHFRLIPFHVVQSMLLGIGVTVDPYRPADHDCEAVHGSRSAAVSLAEPRKIKHKLIRREPCIHFAVCGLTWQRRLKCQSGQRIINSRQERWGKAHVA
jgi:hypothetical protein